MTDDIFDGGGFFGGGYDENPTTTTDVAQICKKGDLITSEFNANTEHRKKHCPKDGEETITQCPHCHNNIAGRITYSNVFGPDDYKVPAYCIECGKPFPWTEEKIRVAQEMAKELEGISQTDIQVLEGAIVEIGKDDAQAQLGATRIKRIMGNLAHGTGDVLKSVITDIASETAKKVLFGT